MKQERGRSPRKAYMKASTLDTVWQHNEVVRSTASGDRLCGFQLGQLL